ncbi:hypothetical protein [Spiroplasma mirum]|uniref:hypothetical protein n=1 Tax=Spiroplasma mirum TaxID=2144 RepID=UPI0003DFBE70|nr:MULTISPECIES: hypothetical protein [Spiroplasma]AHF60904.1 hypothetical protein SMM_0471 [Spiroplasma mirum ATCC 29335]AKM53019.1 hypothetical protein SATRI_v1c05310 [Spiroplasma atrichopogonis]
MNHENTINTNPAVVDSSTYIFGYEWLLHYIELYSVLPKWLQDIKDKEYVIFND